MVKINLLAEAGKKRKKRVKISLGDAGNSIVTGFLALIILEFGGMYYWYMTAEEAAQNANQGMAQLTKEKEEVGAILGKLKDVKKARNKVAKQRLVFEGVDNDKVGPLHTLLFVSYVMQKVDASMPDGEYDALTKVWSQEKNKGMAAGEEPWNPRTVWLKKLVDKDGQVQIEGSAKNHEDVMAFLRRLKTGVYFEGVDLVFQKKEDDATLGLPYVDFKLIGMLNYNPGGYPPLSKPE